MAATIMKTSRLVLVFQRPSSKFFCFLLLLLNFLPMTAPARHFPVCVEKADENTHDDALGRFSYMFNFYRQESNYVPVWEGQTSPAGLIKKFALSSITIEDHNNDYRGVLKNWVHIHVEAAAELEGLYVQAMSAPWGIPFGEFVANFDCGDCDIKTSDYKESIHIVPCAKRAALAYTHPNIFAMGGHLLHNEKDPTLARRVFFNRIHFNFRYTQYPGVDHTFAQFLVIAVRNFKGNHSRFESFYSPIYELDVLDNKIGAFHPFYAGWDTRDITCHKQAVSSDFKRFKGANTRLKLKYNEEFEKCLLNDNLQWFTCPPGPIQMDDKDVPKTIDEWRKLRAGYELKSEVDKNYGENAQFCPDAGTWDWTAGDLQWKLPPEIEIVIEKGESVDLTETFEIEKPSAPNLNGIEGQGYVCEELESSVVCNKEKLTAADCADYYVGDCQHQNLETFRISPSFGKDKKTGDYTLNARRCKDLTYTEQVDSIGVRWGNKWVLVLHGKLMIFTWTVAFNVIAFTTRFMKEYTVIERRSGCFGIGNWLWHHIGWTYVAWSSMLSGVYLIAHHHVTKRTLVGGDDADKPEENYHDLCNVHPTKIETKSCLSYERKFHGGLGMAACLLFFLSYISGWGRPVNKLLRILLVLYHNLSAYIAKVIFLFVMGYGSFSKENHIIQNRQIFFGVVYIEVASLVMFIIATVNNILIDKKFAVQGKRQFPFPEGLDTYEFSPAMQKTIRLILPVHVVIQLVFYGLFIVHYSHDEEGLHCDPS